MLRLEIPQQLHEKTPATVVSHKRIASKTRRAFQYALETGFKRRDGRAYPAYFTDEEIDAFERTIKNTTMPRRIRVKDDYNG